MIIRAFTKAEKNGTYTGYVVSCTAPGKESPTLWSKDGFKSRAAAMTAAKAAKAAKANAGLRTA